MSVSKKVIQAAAGSGAADSYFILTISDAEGINSQSNTAIDTEDNFFVSGSTAAGPGTSAHLLLKVNNDGELQWTRNIGGGGIDSAYGVGCDSSGNAYIGGQTRSNTFGGADLMMSKFNSSGTLQWTRHLGGGGSETGWSATADGSGNAYVGGLNDSNVAFLAAWDSSGSFQWDKTLTGRSFPYGITVDQSGDIILGGNGGYIAKVTASTQVGAWAVTVASTVFREFATDSSNNVYAVGYTASAPQGNYGVVVSKINSSGVFQWTKIIGSSASQLGLGIAVDESDDVYVTGYEDPNGGTAIDDIVIYKLDSSGNLLWGRILQHSDPMATSSIRINSIGTPVLWGKLDPAGGGANSGLVIKVPPDGSGTGTYGGFTYASVSHTAVTSGLAQTETTQATANISFSEAATGFSAATMTPSTSIEEL